MEEEGHENNGSASDSEADELSHLRSREQQKRQRQEQRSIARAKSERLFSMRSLPNPSVRGEPVHDDGRLNVDMAPVHDRPALREQSESLQRTESLRFSAAPQMVGEEGRSFRMAKRTAWVGNIPRHLAIDQAQLSNFFRRFGAIEALKVNLCEEANDQDCCNSWCLVCYRNDTSLQSMQAAAPLMVPAKPTDEPQNDGDSKQVR